MDISNASHYDGATATAEAAVLAYHHFRGKRNRIILSPSVHPHFRQTLRTYMNGYEDIQIVGDEPGANTFATPDEIKSYLDLSTSLVVVGYPDFFGRLFDYTDLAKACHEVGALLCIAVNPMALALFKTPGDFGADIVVGEGQSLGIPLSLGGPYLGIFATKKDLVRKIAGRLVGETMDAAGQRGYVLTLTAREQHIRREKATSNICTNQGLLALCATIYTSLLGKNGLRKVAELCYHKAHYAAEEIGSLPGYRLVTQTPFFNEFVIQTPQPVSEINSHLLDHGILGGFDLSREYPELKDHMLIAVTEMNSRDEIDILRDALQEVKNG
jgi:glycine dehydrogenase subunit 1